MEFWFGCIMDVEELGYNQGYSVIHFVLMYMIARCIKLYEDDIKKMGQWVWILGYLFSTLAIIMCHVIGIKWSWDYSNPIVVFSAVCSFLPFLYKTFHNKVINWIASGTLAVYIIHVTYYIKYSLQRLDCGLLETNSYPMYLIIILGVIIFVFIVSVLYGIVCNYITNRFAESIDIKVKELLDSTR